MQHQLRRSTRTDPFAYGKTSFGYFTRARASDRWTYVETIHAVSMADARAQVEDRTRFVEEWED